MHRLGGRNEVWPIIILIIIPIIILILIPIIILIIIPMPVVLIITMIIIITTQPREVRRDAPYGGTPRHLQRRWRCWAHS